MKTDPKPGHVIHTFIDEHEIILGFLDELEKLNQTIQKVEKYNPREEFDKLIDVAKHLVEAESHYKREEEVLFPELEKGGVFGPPQMMRLEHKDLRERKKELLELTKNLEKRDFKEFKVKLEEAIKFIVFTLREHIFKENNILYPMALEAIKEEKTWGRMKKECDKIGYCCFTPKVYRVK